MSDTQYVIWFIIQSTVTIGLLVAFVMASMGWFERHEKGFIHQLPNEPTSRDALEHRDPKELPRSPQYSKQYWPHVRHS